MQIWDCPQCSANGHTTHAAGAPQHLCVDGELTPMRLAEGALDVTPEAEPDDAPEVDA